MPAQGKALGFRTTQVQALKGRSKISAANAWMKDRSRLRLVHFNPQNDSVDARSK